MTLLETYNYVVASPVRNSPQFVSRANYRGTRFHKPTEPNMSAKVVENSSISGLDVCILKIRFFFNAALLIKY